jgi:hypothetical protein
MREDYNDLRSTSGDTMIGDLTVSNATITVKHDPVNTPAHYAKGKYEVWNIIDYFRLNYRLGNVVKYILRAGVKTPDPLEDLKKARAYLDREIGIREGRIVID